jgi:hypothetical protein
MRYLGAICLWTALFLSSDCFSASMSDVPQRLRVAAECMLKVLKATHGVGHEKLGVFEERQAPRSTDVEQIDVTGRQPTRHGSRVFIEYQTENEKEQRGTIHFEGEEDCGTAGCADSFTAALSGLAAEGEEPSDWGTGLLAKKWKKECNADVLIFFE